MKKMNAGMKALKKEAPAVAKRMGYKKGGMAGCPKCGGDKSKCSCGNYYGGGMAKKRGYNKGGLCGASNPAGQAGTRGIKT